VPKCNDVTLCWCPTPCALVSNKWFDYNITDEKEGLILNISEPEILYKANMTQAKWKWLDIFSWPFPAPTPPIADKTDIVKMDDVVNASDLLENTT
jgi:hypothetical protein